MFAYSIVLFCFLNLLCAAQIDPPKSVAPPEDPMLYKIWDDNDLSEINTIIEKLDYRSYIQRQKVTLFAPTNEAFQKLKFPTEKDEILLNYHMAGVPSVKLEKLSSSILSKTNEAVPLFITRTEKGDTYVNNAKILQDQSTIYDAKLNKNKNLRVLHIIDEVLVPLRPKLGRSEELELNPSAVALLNNHNDYNLSSYHIGIFASRIRSTNRTENFENHGPNTYFIPVDEGMKRTRPESSIDEKVIDAHVIYGKVLFLNATPENQMFETAAFSDSVKVVVSFASETNNGVKRRYVRSNTIVGDHRHPTGVVLSEIVYPNIPLRNGVVHLIQKPLMVIDKTIQDLLDENMEGLIDTFKQKIQYAGEAFRNKISNPRAGITLFIPTNNAWNDMHVEKKLANNKTLLQSILDLHLVPERLPVQLLRERIGKDYSTLWIRRSLAFNVIVQGNNHTLTVEGGGVNATVLHSDIAAINGIIHIIDRVLGIPYATVGMKVASDPIMSTVYKMGNTSFKIGGYRSFNDRLDDETKNFTYFVPRDTAWVAFDSTYPTLAHARKNKPGFANDLLEKHLIEDRNFSMADLKKKSNASYLLQTKNGGLNIRVVENNQTIGSNGVYSIYWENEYINVFRADIPCTNGIIHIIDKVLIKPSDLKNISVGGAHKNIVSFPALLLFVLPLGMMVLYH